jgi:hypothetical protein
MYVLPSTSGAGFAGCPSANTANTPTNTGETTTANTPPIVDFERYAMIKSSG